MLFNQPWKVFLPNAGRLWYISHSVLATDALMKAQVDLQMKPLEPVQDVSTRWNSAYFVLDSLLYLGQGLGVIFAADDKGNLSLSKQEWDVISDVVEMLELVQIVITQLSGEKYAALSLTLPPVHGLC